MKRKDLFLLLIVSIFLFSFWMGVWTSKTESEAHYTPQYAKINIMPILDKKVLTDGDYTLLYEQTGMARDGVDVLFERGEQRALLELQERFFREVVAQCIHSNIFVCYERIMEDKKVYFLPVVQTGDILISFSGHIFGWRYGHAAIVVDGEKRVTAEAVDLGSDSSLRFVEHWAEYPGFALLRVKGASVEQREAAAKYAGEKLVGLPYSIFAIGQAEELRVTQCAHLVWYAYKQFGIDLDSDGGMVVTPADLFHSNLVEIVQIYGLRTG